MKTFSTFYISLCIFLFIGCSEKEEYLTGEINGYVSAYDENGYSISDREGFNITLKNDSLSFYQKTGQEGWYSFEDMPYGNYKIDIQKEGFIQDNINAIIHHIGGYSPTFNAFAVHEIPDYEVSIDSIILEPTFGQRLWAYSKITNTKGLPKGQYELMVYFNDDKDVTKDNYMFYHYGCILKNTISEGLCIMWVNRWVYSYLYPDGYDSLFVRAYPRANYYDWLTVRKEAFGTPSEVFKWIIRE